jgi:2-aminoadipate transaminase
METATQWQQLQPSYIREILAASQQPDIISLAGGLPAGDLLPVNELQPYIEALTAQPDLFQYGGSAGYKPLRQDLRCRYALDKNSELIITSGSQQGLDIIARTYLDSDTHIALEAPCYLGALQVFQLSGATICQVRQTPTGPDLEELEQLFQTTAIKLFYAVPDFHNPTGVCWDLKTRQAVISLCRHYGVFLLEDSPYRALRFSGEGMPSLADLAPDITLQLNSFSKTVTPGIRLGFISGPEQLIDQLLRTRQAMDLHSPLPFQQVLLEFLNSPAYSLHINRLKQVYLDRYTALSESLRSKLNNQVQFNEVEGGMFLWLTLQENAEQFAERALAAGVATVPGCHFYPPHYSASFDARHSLRLNFSHSSIEQLRQAVDRLTEIL